MTSVMTDAFKDHRSMQGFVIEDVTDSMRLAIAHHLIAEKYAEFSSQHLDSLDVFTELCDDRFQRIGLAKTLLAYTTGNRETPLVPLATLRLLLRRDMEGTDTPLEFMGLVTPSVGWDCLRQKGLEADRCAEIGRLAIAECALTLEGRRARLPHRLCRELIREACAKAELAGCVSIWVILHRSVSSFMLQSGINIGEQISVQFNEANHAELFRRYDRYWKQGNVFLHHVKVGDVLSDDASYE